MELLSQEAQSLYPALHSWYENTCTVYHLETRVRVHMRMRRGGDPSAALQTHTLVLHWGINFEVAPPFASRLLLSYQTSLPLEL